MGVLLYLAAGATQAYFGPSEGWTQVSLLVAMATLALSALLGAVSFLASIVKVRPDRPSRARRLLVAVAPVIEDVDINARWHAMGHALIGGIPMAALYALALRKWRPEIIRRIPAQ